MPKENELKPCPFCGNNRVQIGYEDNHYLIFCNHCDVDMTFLCGQSESNKKDAIYLWNTRQTKPMDEEEVFKYIKSVLYNEHYISGGHIDSLDVLSLIIAKAICATFAPDDEVWEALPSSQKCGTTKPRSLKK